MLSLRSVDVIITNSNTEPDEPTNQKNQENQVSGLGSAYGQYWDHSKGHLYGGETDEDVEKRIKTFLMKIKNKTYKNNVLIVTHGNPTSILYKILSKTHPARTHFQNAEFRNLTWGELNSSCSWVERFFETQQICVGFENQPNLPCWRIRSNIAFIFSVDVRYSHY